ncbi:hypothetical protein PGB90_001864 [Kerria lacca]
MNLRESKTVFLILEEYFGPVIASVCEELQWGARPLKLISNQTLPLSIVKQALSILINFNFVEYRSLENNRGNCEYFLKSENIIHIHRYSKFILIIRNKYGKEAEFIIRELLCSGRMTLYNVILKVTFNLSREHPEIPYSLSTIKNSVCDLIENDFIIPVDKVTNEIIPVPIKLTELQKIPNIDMNKLSNLYHGTEKELPKNELYWTVNIDRFLMEYRNDILVSAICRRFGNPSGVIMRHLLKLSFSKNEPWKSVSNPIPMMLLRDVLSNDSNDAVALQYVKYYVDEMEDDSSGFVGRSPEYSGGTLVCFKDAFYHLSAECLFLIIDQKFGSKAARVFNIIRDKKYIEIEQIQRIAMLADKEAKLIVYKLLEESFIQMHELRKPTSSSNSSLNKSFFLYCVDYNLVVTMVIRMVYKGMYNLMIRNKEEIVKYKHIIEKKNQADLLIKVLKEDKASEEQLSEMQSEIRDLMPPEGIGRSSIATIIREDLDYRKLSCRWVPRLLTDQHKERRFAAAIDFLMRYEREGTALLNRVITRDETWVHYHCPESKRQSMHLVKKVRKLMPTVFWDNQVVILERYCERGQTVNAASYCEILDDLQKAIWRKRPGMGKNVFWIHNNARPHAARLTQEKLQQFGWTIFDHPAYSPDLAPSDFHLFTKLKTELGGTHFQNDEELKTTVHEFFKKCTPDFFSVGIEKLVTRYEKCLNLQGDYVEK